MAVEAAGAEDGFDLVGERDVGGQGSCASEQQQGGEGAESGSWHFTSNDGGGAIFRGPVQPVLQSAGFGWGRGGGREGEVGAEFFECFWADAGDAGEVVGVLEWAAFDDAVGHGFADAWEFDEIVAGGGVWVDGEGGGRFGGGFGGGGEIEVGVVGALGAAFFGEIVPVGEGPDAAVVSGGEEFEVAEGFAVFFAGFAVVGLAVDAEGACEAIGDEDCGEVAAVGEGDEGVDAGVAAVAEGAGEGGVDGEGFGEEGAGAIGGGFAEVFGGGDGGFRGIAGAGDAEVLALFAETSGVGLVIDVPFEAVGAVEADGVFLAVFGADAEAVAVGPIGGDEGAVGESDEGFGGGWCGGGEGEEEGECEEEQPEDWHLRRVAPAI